VKTLTQITCLCCSVSSTESPSGVIWSKVRFFVSLCIALFCLPWNLSKAPLDIQHFIVDQSNCVSYICLDPLQLNLFPDFSVNSFKWSEFLVIALINYQYVVQVNGCKANHFPCTVARSTALCQFTERHTWVHLCHGLITLPLCPSMPWFDYFAFMFTHL